MSKRVPIALITCLSIVACTAGPTSPPKADGLRADAAGRKLGGATTGAPTPTPTPTARATSTATATPGGTAAPTPGASPSPSSSPTAAPSAAPTSLLPPGASNGPSLNAGAFEPKAYTLIVKRGADGSLQDIMFRPNAALAWSVEAAGGNVAVQTVRVTFEPDPLLPAPDVPTPTPAATATPTPDPALSPPPTPPPTPTPAPTPTHPPGAPTPPPLDLPPPPVPPTPPPTTPTPGGATPEPTPAPSFEGQPMTMDHSVADLGVPSSFAPGAAQTLQLKLDTAEFSKFVAANPSLRAVKVRVALLGAGGQPVKNRFEQPLELEATIGVL